MGRWGRGACTSLAGGGGRRRPGNAGARVSRGRSCIGHAGYRHEVIPAFPGLFRSLYAPRPQRPTPVAPAPKGQPFVVSPHLSEGLGILAVRPRVRVIVRVVANACAVIPLSFPSLPPMRPTGARADTRGSEPGRGAVPGRRVRERRGLGKDTDTFFESPRPDQAPAISSIAPRRREGLPLLPRAHPSPTRVKTPPLQANIRAGPEPRHAPDPPHRVSHPALRDHSSHSAPPCEHPHRISIARVLTYGRMNRKYISAYVKIPHL